MRSNSIGLRLNYSSSWQNKIIPGKSYVDQFVKTKFVLNNYLKGVFQTSFLSEILINSRYNVYFAGNKQIILNVYTYLPRYSDILNKMSRKNNRNVGIGVSHPIKKKASSLLLSYVTYNYLKIFLVRVKHILLSDLQKILPNNRVSISFIVVKKKYFDASLASLYVTNKLINKFKLDRVIEDLGEDLVLNKRKSGVIVHCSGRFDRKERASFSMFGKGKISLTTLQNKITYHHSEAVLKYGVCGIKVWVLE